MVLSLLKLWSFCSSSSSSDECSSDDDDDSSFYDELPDVLNYEFSKDDAIVLITKAFALKLKSDRSKRAYSYLAYICKFALAAWVVDDSTKFESFRKLAKSHATLNIVKAIKVLLKRQSLISKAGKQGIVLTLSHFDGALYSQMNTIKAYSHTDEGVKKLVKLVMKLGLNP